MKSSPFSGRVCGDIEVDDFSSQVVKNDEAEKHSESSGRYDEEVASYRLVHVVLKKSPPCLRRAVLWLDSVFVDCRFGNVMAEKLEFGLDSGRSPQRILLRHFADQSGDLESGSFGC